MRTVLRSYEPVFGGIVAILAAAFLCFVLFTPSPRGVDGPTVYVMWYSGNLEMMHNNQVERLRF
jgi:hypothetical protein